MKSRSQPTRLTAVDRISGCDKRFVGMRRNMHRNFVGFHDANSAPGSAEVESTEILGKTCRPAHTLIKYIKFG